MRRLRTPPEGGLQFSGHETFPLRQLWLRKAVAAVQQGAVPGLLETAAPASVFAAEHAIADFGVGKNMVTAIRHWALACGFLRSDAEGLGVGRLGLEIIGDSARESARGLDPYLEHTVTPWLLHWMLASRGARSTTWHWLFNHVVQPTFDRDWLLRTLKQFVAEHPAKTRVSDATLKRDIECCMRSYVPQLGGDSPEEVAEPVLGELGIVTELSKGTFAFQRGPKHALNDGLFAFCLLDFWLKFDANASSLAFHTVAHEIGSPGRVFKLDENSVAERMLMLEEFTEGRLVWTDAAGLRQISRRKEAEQVPESYRWDLLRKAYA